MTVQDNEMKAGILSREVIIVEAGKIERIGLHLIFPDYFLSGPI